MQARRIGSVLVLRGVLDARCTASLRELIQEHARESGPRVVLDFACVELVDRHVLRLLVAAAHRASKQDQVLVLIDPSPALRRALSHPGLRRLLSLERSVSAVAVTA